MFCLQQNLEMLRLIEPFWYMGARKPGKKLSQAYSIKKEIDGKWPVVVHDIFS